MLVTCKVIEGLPSLRSELLAWIVEDVLRRCCERGGFRLCEYSIQSNHLHLIVEADSREDLAAGMKSLTASLARRLNRALGRKGALYAKRYHLQRLRSPRQVLHALAYTLKNHSKHTGSPHLDALSSAPQFAHWSVPLRGDLHLTFPWLPDPRTWTLRSGWHQFHGHLSPRPLAKAT